MNGLILFELGQVHSLRFDHENLAVLRLRRHVEVSKDEVRFVLNVDHDT